MTLTKRKTAEAGCPTCGATGHFGDESRPQDNPFCPDCRGRGKISLAPDQARPCPDCKGRGHVESVPCIPCAHTGRIMAAAGPPSVEPSKENPMSNLVAGLQAENAALKKELADLKTKK